MLKFSVSKALCFFVLSFCVVTGSFSQKISSQNHLAPKTFSSESSLDAEIELFFIMKHEINSFFSNLQGTIEQMSRQEESETFDFSFSKFFEELKPQYSFIQAYSSLLSAFLENNAPLIHSEAESYQGLKEEDLKDPELFNENQSRFIQTIMSLSELFKSSDRSEINKKKAEVFSETKQQLEKFKVLSQDFCQQLNAIEYNAETLSYLEKEFILSIKEDFEGIFFWINFYFGYEEINMTSFSPYKWFQEVKKIFNFSEDKDSLYHLEIEGIKEKNIYGSSEAFSFILKNLIRNAQKHGKATKLKIKAEQLNEDIIVEFSNNIGENGKIIEPYWLELVSEKKEHLLAQRLFLQNYTTSEEDGQEHGIGLKLIWKLVKMMKGEVSAKSTSQGTTFTLRFPLNKFGLSQVAISDLRLPHFSELELFVVEKAL